MKSFSQFSEDLQVRKKLLAQRRLNQTSSFVQKGAELQQKGAQGRAQEQEKRAQDRAQEQERQSLKRELKREIVRDMRSEAYDKDVMGSSQIRRTGEGGRVGAERKKTPQEIRRTRAVGGGKTEPATPYKPRKDIGTQRQASTRVQQPEKERGSAALSPREAQRKAYLERKRREAGKEKPTSASELLRKKEAPKAAAPGYKPPKASGLTRKERLAQTKKGERLLRDIILQKTGKKSEKELRHKYTSK